MGRQIAVLDIGTNTFHLLIAEVTGVQTFREVYREKIFVKIASDGIGHIGSRAYQRAMDALQRYRDVLDARGVEPVYAVATEALRKADNTPQFLSEASLQYGFDIKLISGEEEAALILRGIRAAVNFNDQPVLIIDIGGGSVELMIWQENKLVYLKSFPLGAQVLRNAFHHTEPITTQELSRMEKHINRVLADFFIAADKYWIHHMIGSSGTFDTLLEILHYPQDHLALFQHDKALPLPLSFLNNIMGELQSKTLEERKAVPGMHPERAEMIVVALALIRLIMDKISIHKITVSHYALKEGLIMKSLGKQS